MLSILNRPQQHDISMTTVRTCTTENGPIRDSTKVANSQTDLCQQKATVTEGTCQKLYTQFVLCCGFVRVNFTHIPQDHFTGTGTILQFYSMYSQWIPHLCTKVKYWKFYIYIFVIAIATVYAIISSYNQSCYYYHEERLHNNSLHPRKLILKSVVGSFHETKRRSLWANE